MLRMLYCKGSVDQLDRVCMGHGPRRGSNCPKCDGGMRLYRNPELELEAWGPVENPKVKVKWRSYVDDNEKNTADIHCHEDHPSVFISHLLATLEVYKHHYVICQKQKAAHLELERNFLPHQLLLDVDFAENFTIIMGREIQVAIATGSCKEWYKEWYKEWCKEWYKEWCK
jgi:hypothetical protein